MLFSLHKMKRKKHKTKPKKLLLSIMIQVKLEKQTATDKVYSDCFFP